MKLAKLKTSSSVPNRSGLSRRVFVFAVSLFTSSAVLSGCSGREQKQWKPETERRAFAVAPRQLAPEPVYNRLRWVHPPDVLPSREIAQNAAPVILPVIHLDLKNSTLDQAAAALASSSRYSSFCASSIANRRISISKLGTIDELANEIEAVAKIRVQVDHQGHALRFFPKPTTAPTIYATGAEPPAATVVGQEVLKNEYKSDN